MSELPAGFVASVRGAVPNVMEIDLRSNALTELPADLADLKSLKVLKLNYNRLPSFPTAVVGLPRLQSLELSGNQIAHVDYAVGQMPALTYLDLSGNQLGSLPDTFTEIGTLVNVNLENNLLEELPEDIGILTALQKLDLSTNRLSELPQSMGQLRGLLKLDASSNQLAGVPASMGHLKHLREMDLRYNDLKEPSKSRLEEGLFKFLAFLREEEERMRLEELERLKPVGVEVGSWTEYRIKRPPAECPLMRAGHSVCACGAATVLYGGTYSHEGGARTAELWHIDTVRMEWSLLRCVGDAPGLRDGHCAAWDGGSRMYVFGGRNAERKRTNELYYLDLEPNDEGEYTWTRLAADGAVPPPREGACAVCHDGSLMVFGGRGSGARYNDLFFYDPKSNMWSQPTTMGSSPSPRCNAALAAHGGMLFVHGGQANFLCADLFALNLREMMWLEVATLGAVPSAVHHHIATVRDGCLNIFGGVNELGGANYSLNRLTLGDLASSSRMSAAAVETSATARRVSVLVVPVDKKKVWVSVLNQLSHSDARIAAFAAEGEDHKLHVYQFGSPSLGYIPLNDAGTPGKFLDVFKTVRVGALEHRVGGGDVKERANAKAQRVSFTIRTKVSTLPSSYSSTSDKEAKTLEYVESFRAQFIELYPQRRPLLLTPVNECGVNKFVCTTVRPTMTEYSELYDAGSCARFVADFLKYEPLREPLHYPEHIPSPHSVLGYQAGDCFDFSIVLASLLLGVGYDAYVVVGYAPRWVTECDQSHHRCPLLAEERLAAEREAAKAADASKANAKKPSKYAIPEAAALESEFLASKRRAEERAVQEAQDVLAAAKLSDDSDAPPPEEVDPIPPGKRVHCWVLVLAGKREVTESFFIEPSTGTKHAPGSSPYQGIEVLFNQRNYWTNMQQKSVSAGSVKGCSFNLRDASKWERMLEDSMFDGVPLVPEGGAEGGGEAGSRGSIGGASDGLMPIHGDAAPKGGAMDGVGDDEHLIPDAPPSWVRPLSLPRERFDLRCPKGAKTTQFHRCHLDIFATYGDSARWDGMVQRLTLFSDDDCSDVIECRECYERRKDRLRKRVLYPERDESIETFDRGALYGVREITIERKVGRSMLFFPESRLDGLVERKEEFGVKMVETFVNRDDNMTYRSVSYDPTPDAPASAEEAVSASAQRQREKAEAEQLAPVRKVSEKFARDPARPAAEDVAKRVFYVGAAQIKLQFHYAPGRITASSRVYTKDGTAHETQVDPFAVPPKESELLDEFQRLIAMEKECLATVRAVEQEVSDITTRRAREEQNITLLVPFYDVVRVAKEESDGDEDETEGKVLHDYLSPFMPAVSAQRPLTHGECKDVRKSCLRALKDRLIERANIIQARHDEETAALAKRQANFQRDRDQMTRAEEEEYERACEESMFRIHILEQRLKRHEEAALSKYYGLDAKLRSDPRLVELGMA